MGQDLLFVGDHSEADLITNHLQRAGITVHNATNVLAAERFLDQRKDDEPGLVVLVQPNLPLCSVDDVSTPENAPMLERYNGVDTRDRGQALIQHARQSGLLPSTVRAYLATYDDDNPPSHPIEGFSETIRLATSEGYRALTVLVNRSHHGQGRYGL